MATESTPRGTSKVELAPVYRYYVTDLLTDKVLAEIPFGNVSYDRAVKAAGAFQGTVPVIDATAHLNLYENTMPGQTSLYVVRNGICVWGGIIWSRKYDIVKKDLQVSASEFTSYLQHRKIWKTWNHQYECTVKSTLATSYMDVTVLYAAATEFPKSGAVLLEFDEEENSKLNGSYDIVTMDQGLGPTVTNTIRLSGSATAKIVRAELTNFKATVHTQGAHYMNVGDVVAVSAAFGDPENTAPPFTTQFNGSVTITQVGPTWITYDNANSNVLNAAATGTISRKLPAGTYDRVTLTTHRDTYDYVRSLLETTFSDFTGIMFPNDYIEPGVRREIGITSKKLDSGEATIITDTPHGLVAGQAVVISNLGAEFDGEYQISDILSPTSFQYIRGGAVGITAVSPINFVISGYSAYNGIASLTTTAAHGLKVGQYVEIDLGTQQESFNGVKQILSVPSSTTFTMSIPDFTTIAPVTLTDTTVTINGQTKVLEGVASEFRTTYTFHELTFRDPIDNTYINPITAASDLNIRRAISEKSLTATSNLASVSLPEKHYLTSGRTVTVSGAADILGVNYRIFPTTSTMRVRTDYTHNYKVGQSVVIADTVDRYPILGASTASNVGIITITEPNNEMAIGNAITVRDHIWAQTISSASIVDGVGTITFASNHQYDVNTEVTIKNTIDTISATNVQVFDGVAIFSLDRSHNFFEGQEIIVTNAGAPYNGKWKISSTTESRIMVQMPDTVAVIIAPKRVTATIKSVNGSVFDGEHVISAKTANSVSFPMTKLYNQSSSTVSNGNASGLSILNGTRVITARTATTVSFAMPGASNTTYSLAQVPAKGEPTPVVETPGKANGTHTIVSIGQYFFDVNLASNGSSKQLPTPSNGTVSAPSIFNGTKTIISLRDDNTFDFTLSGQSSNVTEAGQHSSGYVTIPVSLTFPVSAQTISLPNRTIGVEHTVATGMNNVFRPYHEFNNRGRGVMRPVAIVSSFGPFPGNSSIGLRYNTGGYSGVNVQPTTYRGFELKTVGEILDQYSDTMDGFEYRIDCSYDWETNQFSKTFVILPINKPNPPAPGEISPISRFDAHKTVFEYPGNIISVTLDESAENSATRMFVAGENDLSADAGPPIGVATSNELLSGEGVVGRKWPLLDDSDNVKGVDDESMLYSYAQKYLSEIRPPDATLDLQVNGSLQPVVGSYSPGDWCSLIIRDTFIDRRLSTDLEPRDDIIIRKIDAVKVKVPDAVTFPETVTLTLVPEWEVDKRG